MTEQTDADRQALAESYMQASAELDDLLYSDIRAAGQRRDYEDLIEAIRNTLTTEVRSSVICAMIRETLNAFEEGQRKS